MNVQEKRIIGALLLLLGVSFFAAGICQEQISYLIELLKTTFKPF
ncbi:MAG: hypothetical protein QXM86_01390 [Candidatus Bathyarchaeia archaeon]